jgi:Family of unknown function (DUF6636)
MKMRMVWAILTGSAVAAIPLAAIVRADTFYQFQSPSGNIDCGMGALDDNAYASCEITDHTWVAPPRPPVCEGVWGDRIEMYQGSPPALVCSSDTLRGNGLPTLPYGQIWSVKSITCDSEPSGMTCTDASTGHFFRIARGSYELH